MESNSSQYNPIHASIAHIENVLPLLATTTIGGINAGLPGAAACFILSGTELIANYLELYERPYLTSAILGAATFSNIDLPYHASTILGGLLGLLTPTGFLNNYITIAPFETALYGYSYAGNYGASLGFAIGSTDEALYRYNITNTYYLSTITKNIAISNLIINIISKNTPAPLKGSIGIALGAIELYYTDPPKPLEAKALFQELENTYSRVIDTKRLNVLITSQAISSAATSIIIQLLSIKLSTNIKGYREAVFSFKDAKDDTFSKFIQQLKNLTIFLPIYVTGRTIENLLDSFFNSRLHYEIQDLIDEKLFQEEAILKLAQSNYNNTDYNTLIKRRREDIETITYQGAGTASSALSTTTKGIFATSVLISQNAHNVLIFSALYTSITNLFSTWITSTTKLYNTKTVELSDKLTSLEEHFRTNSDSIEQRNANHFITETLTRYKNELRIVSGQQFTWGTAQRIWNTAKSIMDTIISILVTTYHIHTKEIIFDNFYTINFMLDDVFTLLAWPGENAGTITNIKISTQRLNELLDRLEYTKHLPTPHRNYKKQKNNSTWLCLDKLEVKAGNTTLTNTEHLCFSNSITSITGESRSGKSTFLKLLKGLEYSSSNGSGNFTFYNKNEKPPKIIMASQHYALSPYITLIEAITLKPLEEARTYETTIKGMMKEIEIDSNSHFATGLDSLLYEEKEDWSSYLTSGGVRKKLMSLWVVIEKPDIAILDEIFAGIDQEAIQRIQTFFRNHLPDTKFLVVDHEADSHKEGFYS